MSLKSWQKCFGSLIISAVLLVLLGGVFSPANAEEPRFVEIQSIPTTAAWKWEQFSIGNDTYLMLGTYGTPGTPSKLYKWNGNSFVEFQSFPEANTWKHFVINNEHYLSATQSYFSATQSDSFKTYKWNGSVFVEFQSVPVSYGFDCEFFTIGTNYYMAVARFSDDFHLYKWNGAGFVFFQTISTESVLDAEFFTIGSNYYLAAAVDIDLMMSDHHSIYRWDGNKFVYFQGITTGSSVGFKWKYFTIDTDNYLAIYDGSGLNLYKWNGTNFSSFQSIPKGGDSWGIEYYDIGSDHYLISQGEQKIYKWSGTNFAEFQTMPAIATGSWDWKHFMIGNEHYLAGAAENSKIYKWGIPSTRIINLSGSLAFGDVTVGKTKQLTMTVSNSGNSILTVNSVAFPSGFSGSWNGTIPAGGSQNVTVTFSPTAVQAYSGTVTVNSDKTDGVNTIAISGNGITDPCQCTDTNGSTQQGIDLVKANPGSYQLLTQTQSDQKIADAVSAATVSMYTKAQLDQAVKTEQLKWDANGDGRIGLEDIIRMLQVIAGLRP